jgi:hypothetical protein
MTASIISSIRNIVGAGVEWTWGGDACVALSRVSIRNIVGVESTWGGDACVALGERQ